MKSAFVVVSLVILAGLAFGVFSLQLNNSSLQEQLALAQGYSQQLQEQTELNTRQRLAFEKQLEELQDQLLSTSSQLTSIDAALKEARSQANPEYEALLEKARMEVAQQPQRRRQGSAGGLGAFFDPDTARSLAADIMPQMYENFLNTLGIPGEERQVIMEAMIDFSSQRYQNLGELLAGNLSTDQAMALFGPQAILNGMDDLLTAEQVSELAQYDSLVQQDSARHIYGSELSRMGDAISGSTQDLVIDTLLNEVYSSENNYGALVSPDGSMTSAHNSQVDAYNRARDTLQADLNDDQLNQLDRFINNRSNVVDVVMEATTDGNGRVSVRSSQVGLDDLPN